MNRAPRPAFTSGPDARRYTAKPLPDAWKSVLTDLQTQEHLGALSESTSQLIRAVAAHLAQRGVTEWHFSEMARALEFIFPDRYTGYPGRNVTSRISALPEVFEASGAKGVWRLREHGDGHQSNKAAVTAVLSGSDRPLSVAGIQQRLQRPLRTESLRALLDREDEFRSNHQGRYFLAGQFGSEQAQIDALLARCFSETQEDLLPETTLRRAALDAGLDPDLARAFADTSATCIFLPGKQAYTRADSEALQIQRFRTWYFGRKKKKVPARPEVLTAGLRRALTGGLPHQIEELRSLYAARGWDFPELPAVRPDDLPTEKALLKRFRHWNHNRKIKKSPARPNVLMAGLNDALSKGQTRRVEDLRSHYAERGWDFPELPGAESETV